MNSQTWVTTHFPRTWHVFTPLQNVVTTKRLFISMFKRLPGL